MKAARDFVGTIKNLTIGKVKNHQTSENLEIVNVRINANVFPNKESLRTF